MTETADVSAATLTGDYLIDPVHSRVGFVARHAMITKVRGQFNSFDGRARLDFDDPANSTAEVTIEVASVDTRNPQRDEHLRTNDFFDAATYPQIRFISAAVEVLGDDRYAVTGDLTIKGITKTVTVPFVYTGSSRDPYGDTRVGFEGRAVINRRDWGVEWNAALETGGVLVSENIALELEVSAVKTDPAE